MSNAIAGRKGRVKVGNDVIGELRDWSVSVTGATIDVTSRDSGGWEESVPGNKSWTVSADALYLTADSAQDAVFTALDGDAIVSLELLPEGDTLGDTEYSGDALVTTWELSSPHESASAVSLEFQGTGALTKGEVS